MMLPKLTSNSITHNTGKKVILTIKVILATMIGFVIWSPFFTLMIIQYKRWPSDKANHSFENNYQTIICNQIRISLNNAN